MHSGPRMQNGSSVGVSLNQHFVCRRGLNARPGLPLARPCSIELPHSKQRYAGKNVLYDLLSALRALLRQTCLCVRVIITYVRDNHVTVTVCKRPSLVVCAKILL